MLHRHRATLLGAATAATFFLLLAFALPALGPGTSPASPAGMADPAAAQQHAKQLQQAVQEATEAKRQLQDVTQQLRQAQAAAKSAHAESDSEGARLQELLASSEAEVRDWRQQAQEAKAAAQQQEADFDRAAAEIVQKLRDAAEAHSSEVQQLQQQIEAERRSRAEAEARAAAAGHSATATGAKAAGSASTGSKDSVVSSQPSAAEFMSPRWTLQRLAAQVCSLRLCCRLCLPVMCERSAVRLRQD